MCNKYLIDILWVCRHISQPMDVIKCAQNDLLHRSQQNQVLIWAINAREIMYYQTLEIKEEITSIKYDGKKVATQLTESTFSLLEIQVEQESCCFCKYLLKVKCRLYMFPVTFCLQLQEWHLNYSKKVKKKHVNLQFM